MDKVPKVNMVHIVATLSIIVDRHVNESQAIKQEVAQLATRVTGLDAMMDFLFEQLMEAIKSIGKEPTNVNGSSNSTLGSKSSR